MKILIVVPNTTIANGITSSAINFSNEMIKRGHSIYFLDMSGKMQNVQNFNKNVVPVKLEGKSKYWNVGVSDVKSSRGLKKLFLLFLGAVKKITVRLGIWEKIIFSPLREHNDFDVAIAFRQVAPCYAYVINNVKAKKKFAFIHGELTHMGDISSWDRYFKDFDKIACVSNAVRDQFSEKYSDISNKFITVYNMLDIERLKKLSKEPPAVEINKDIINIATVARIENDFKRIDWIVQICDKLKKNTNLKFHWYVIGNGPDYDRSINLAKEKQVDDVLTFTGSQANPYSIVDSCNFTVLTSKSESFGMVVAESIILGKPVIVTKYPAIYEIMEDGREGIIVEQDIDMVYKNVLKMIKNEDNILEKLSNFSLKKNISNENSYNQFVNAI